MTEITAREIDALTKSVGKRSGEKHPKAKLSDAQVAAMRALYAQWQAEQAHLPKKHPFRRGYKSLAKLYGCAWATARDICMYRTRK